MEKYLGEALAAGIIRPFSSPAGAGFFFVGRKDGSLHQCIDYRGMNDITIKNWCPLPLMTTAFKLLPGATTFTKLDLCNAYHLVRIREGDKWKTAFNTSTSHWEYLVMPFGLTNAPAVFQGLVNDVLRDMINHTYSYSPKARRNTPLMSTKCYVACSRTDCSSKRRNAEFSCSSTRNIQYGSREGLVVEWPKPTDRKTLQRFLVFANFYRRFTVVSQPPSPTTLLPRSTSAGIKRRRDHSRN